ncbi:MAG: rhomboid family intramembrane serine protease [Haloarculaceae archaeon]
MAFDGPLVGWGSLAALVVGVGGSLYAVVRLSDWQPLATARRRLLLGVPVGTVLTFLFLNLVFWVVQGAADGQPVVVGFRSWSVFYPVGMLTAAFAHNGLGHLTGNVLATLVFAPVAEYAWSHYPTERGSASFSSVGTNPFARVGAFLLAVLGVGLATSLFTPGALIGFSGVVFAFAGFALVTRPLLAVAAIVGQQAVGLVYFGLQNPVLTASTQTRVVAPSWANVAIQGHALGLVIGVVLGLLLVRRRERSPDVRYVWFAALVFAVSQALYAFYLPLSTERFVLFRGVGTGAVFLLAAVVATAAADTDRTVLARIDLSRREVATGLLLAVLFALALAAVPYNLADVSGEVDPEDPNTAGGVEVRDYTVAYVEGVPNQYIEAVEIPVVGGGLSVNESGVVVTSDRRNAWEVVVSRSQLAFRGRASVPVGGVGWRERVVVNRTQWSMTGGGTAYKVYLKPPGEPRKLAFGSDPATADPVINGTLIRVAPVPQPGGYRVELVENETVAATTPVPVAGANRTLRGLTFNRTGSKLRVVEGDTVVTIATYRSGRK